ncbi:MAG: hypothetical protein M1508_12725 [Nitrospirae bacterium]|nr:hypothetical protein [Nitrospirota bacterium]MCL5422038.1 hypothetical protein [Nitrospirota bacterium]
MPTLGWIGKKAVLNHHREVPYRLLRCDNSRSVGDPDAWNALTSLNTSLLVDKVGSFVRVFWGVE